MKAALVGERDPVATTSIARVDATPQPSAQTLAWLAEHPSTRELVESVWDALAELERADHHPRLLATVRFVLSQASFMYFVMTCMNAPPE